MRVSVDANVFSGLLSGEKGAVSTMRVALEKVSDRAILVASPVVYAELAAGRSTEAVDSFLLDKSIEGLATRRAGVAHCGLQVRRVRQGASTAERRRYRPPAHTRRFSDRGVRALPGPGSSHVRHQDLRHVFPEVGSTPSTRANRRPYVIGRRTVPAEAARRHTLYLSQMILPR